MTATVLAAFTLLFRLLGIVLEEDEFPGSLAITEEEEERFTERQQQQQDGDNDKGEESKVAFVIEDEEREKETRMRNLRFLVATSRTKLCWCSPTVGCMRLR
eukprot:GHVU01113335.1.p2 GENE.GHVU01113335.1~~GHVU01113335.1.p2  ORF type:complete len:102 (-),score=26.40 GHVU01113335.1:648-953(-)